MDIESLSIVRGEMESNKRIALWHNILWSRYKGRVFSELSTLSPPRGMTVEFFQIAATDSGRASLSSVDMSYHGYPFELIFDCAYDAIPSHLLVRKLFWSVWTSNAELIILPGYHRPEYWAMLFAAILRRKKKVVFSDSTRYDQPYSFSKGFLKRFFFSWCDGFLSYGERARSYLLEYGVPAEKVFRRCQAAALPAEYSAEAALQQRRETAPSMDRPRFLYVGRLSPEKSLDVLLQAFSRVRQVMPAATLVLVGAGPQRGELVALAESLEVADAVTFAGGMDAVALGREYAKATCLVLPSQSEPWGLVVNEALSYGCPVVVSHRCGCVPELVEGKKTGIVFEAGNVDDLASSLVTSPKEFSNIETVAKDCVELISEFSPKASALAILAACMQIIGRG